MKVTDKKFLNVHQTIGPLTSTSNSAAKSNSVDVITAKAADKVLVRNENQERYRLPSDALPGLLPTHNFVGISGQTGHISLSPLF